jgi:hypothetical protein
VDNYSTHKTAVIRRWFAKRPRFHVHFTPTYGSWINLHNEDPTPFAWTKTADQILASIARYAQRTTAAHAN